MFSLGTGSWASSDFQMPQGDGHCILCEGSRLNCSIDECTGHPALVACGKYSYLLQLAKRLIESLVYSHKIVTKNWN